MSQNMDINELKEELEEENQEELEENQEELEEEEEPEEQLDPDMLRAIREAIMNKSTFDFCVKGETKKSGGKKEMNTKKKNSMTLGDFNKQIDEKIKESQPKKFTSKRADDKRKTLGLDVMVEPKRTFNPRKQPYNFVNRKKIINSTDVNSMEEFPTM